MGSFSCFVLSPIELANPNLLIAAVRAGGIGVLDRAYCPAQKLDQATKNLAQLLASTQGNGRVGLRFRADQILVSDALLLTLSTYDHWLILSEWEADSLQANLTELAQENRRIVLEITDREQLSVVQALNPDLDGLIAKGHEAGGQIGEDATFVLLQKLCQQHQYPVYVQGGIGLHTAAACRAVGAAGVVLDDQLWLMPESPFPQSWQQHLINLNGQEAIPVGERLGVPYRVLSRPGFKAVERLQVEAEQLEVQINETDLAQVWQARVQAELGWDDPAITAWPMGQAVGLAATYRQTYGTTGRLIQAILAASRNQLEQAQALQPLAPRSPLAVSHNTEYPVVQGPMTRVSDTAQFAEAVATQGGLPLLALALMKGSQVRQLLQETQQRLQGKSWGIGILGFVPQAVREEQMREILAVKPPFAVIAGGRPDQAAHLEAQGIATYLHIPVPALLKLFLEQGARRFIFEGRECGGHVGPLSSFTLWESMITTLLAEVSEQTAPEVHVLFAGGIHDAHSAAMIAAMAAPLAERGMKIGVLMGSAYLFTEEAVSCGAILPEFQAQALSCQRTINLETGPGHASRCAVTPFAQEFYATRRRLMAEGSSPEAVKTNLEDLTLGRLRIASKGVTRDQSGQIVSIQASQQLNDGMYMIGQVATLRQAVTTVRALHQEVSVGGTEQLLAVTVEPAQTAADSRPSDIAIIGIASFLPQALDPDTLWVNLLNGVSALTEIPSHRWDWNLYYDADRAARDKVYSRWGGFLEDIPFNPLQFGIPPKSLKSIDPAQLLTLLAVHHALEDAHLHPGDFDGESTSVIFGAGGGIADLGQQYATRSGLPQYVDAPTDAMWERLPEWTEESFPGLLLNVIAGRVANRFDLGGSNFTVDAACASSLAALNLAVQELETGRSNLVITGGVDTVQNPFAYLCFSKSQALSPQGQPRTFDQQADGIVISEGIGVLVLKRLADAERDGDRIYAVIKAVAGSSDGKALGMTAPRSEGQMRAVERAYAKAGFSPRTLSLYEAHGTGTAAGDRAELETINRSLVNAKATPKSCAIGSLKTLIGHTKSTAGVAGLTKVAMALYHQVLPPHVGVETPLPTILDPTSPVYLLKQPRPWLANPNHPRRAAVSAFGFGGTNFHAVLEEYTGALTPPRLGANRRPWELLVWRAASQPGLLAKLTSLRQALQAGANPDLQDLAYTLARQAETCKHPKVVVAIVTSDRLDLQVQVGIAIDHLEGRRTDPLPPQVQINQDLTTTHPVALLFPGQGSQYPNMGREVALYFAEVRQALEVADWQLQAQLPEPLSQLIYPPAAYNDATENEQIERLKTASIAQPAIGAISAGLLALLQRLNLEPDMVAGHSYGEYTALYAAGCLSREGFFHLSAVRGQVMAAACQGSDGAMAAVQAPREQVLSYLQDFPEVVLANHNAPLQCVISGPRSDIEILVNQMEAVEITARRLPVAGAFHSPLMQAVQSPLQQAITAASMALPQMPVYSNVTGQPYPASTADIQTQLANHALAGVEFVNQVEAMYASGARVFVEVGPRQVLTRLVDQILADRPHLALSLDSRDQGLQGLFTTLATLAVQGLPLRWSALFDDCQVTPLNLNQLVADTAPTPLAASTWFVNGGSVRSAKEPVGYSGQRPPLTATASKSEASLAVKSPPLDPANSGSRSEAAMPPALLPPMPAAPPNQSGPRRPTLAGSPPPPPTPPSMAPSTVPSTYPSMPMSPSPMSQDAALAAYQAYQQTMQQFLAVQEQVMRHFLTGGQGTSGQNHHGYSHSGPSQIGPVSPGHSQGNGQWDGGQAAAWINPRPISAPPSMPVAPTANPPGAYARMAPEVESQPTGTGSNGPNGYGSNGVTGNGATGNGVQAGTMAKMAAPLPPSPIAPSPAPAAPMPVPTPQAAPPVPPVVGSTAGSGESSITPDSLIPQLLELVSDRTGYPAEMLGLDQDLEAELGIDSIKRVEILGALQKTLPPDLGAALQIQMEQLTRTKTLNGVVDQILALASGDSQSGSTPAAPAATSASPITLDPEALIRQLLELVSDRTGYPAEMLGLEQDLEAELGIDSIKRVEILGALQKTLPATLGTALQAQMEQLTRLKSLQAIVTHVLSLVEAPAQESNGLGKPAAAALPSPAI